MQFLYLQDTQFLCKVCGDRFFKTRYDITRHLEEQHGGFAYKCNICNWVYNRAGKHASCRAGRDEMLLFHRQTGARGLEAQQQLEEYYRTKLPQLWEAVPVENRAFPQPRDIPHQNFHRSRLEGLYPKQQVPQPRRQSNHPQFSCNNNNPTSAKSSQYSYKSDLDNYVDDIQLEEPASSETTTEHRDDPQLAGVTFESPIRVSSPVCFSSPSSSSSYCSTCCSGSDSESESEKEEGLEEPLNLCLTDVDTDKRVIKTRKRKASGQDSKDETNNKKMNISEETKVSISSESVDIEMREDCENKKSDLKQNEKDAKRDDNKKSDLKQNEKGVKRADNKKSDLKQNEKDVKRDDNKKSDLKQNEKDTKRDDNKKSDLKQNEKDAKRDGNKKSDLKQNEKDAKRDGNKKSDLKQNEKDAKRDGNKKSDLKQNEKDAKRNDIKKGDNNMQQGDTQAKKGNIKDSHTTVKKDERSDTQNEKVDSKSENDDNINNEGEIQDEFAYLNETAVQWLERNWNDNTFYNISRLFTTLRYRGSTRPYERNASPRPMTNVAFKTFTNLQRIQESPILLEIGGQVFQTSKLTLLVDPNSLLGMLFRKTCPMRPSGNTFKFDRDPTHFRYILNYLRNGGHLDKMTLPQEKKDLLELITEVRYFCLKGMEEIVLDRLELETGSRDF